MTITEALVKLAEIEEQQTDETREGEVFLGAIRELVDMIIEEAAAADNARTYNVCANGEGENPIDVAHELDWEWQERTWAEVEAGRFVGYPVKPDWMTTAEWSGYLNWTTEQHSTASAMDRDAAGV